MMVVVGALPVLLAQLGLALHCSEPQTLKAFLN